MLRTDTLRGGRLPAVEPGGWFGWREFLIDSRSAESDNITSFVLRPKDEKPVILHRPGQHLLIRADVDGRPSLRRSYSISSAPNGRTYRISVKREVRGVASNWLHQAPTGTSIKAMVPRGNFSLALKPERPVVLVSAGVGVTPMISMLEAAANGEPRLPLTFVHCTANGSTHAFASRVAELVGSNPTFRKHIFYSRPRSFEAAGVQFDHEGRISVNWLQQNTPIAEAEFYLCGPREFLRTLVPGLISAGVPRRSIHLEFFGPIEDLVHGGEHVERPEWKEAEQPRSAAAAVRRHVSEEDLGRALLSSVSDGVIASDEDGTITFWNPGAVRIFGFSAEEAAGQKLDLIIPHAYREQHWGGYHAAVAAGESRYGAGDVLSVPALTKSGQRISIDFTIVLLRGATGKVTGMVASIRDNTKRFEETRALQKRLERLVHVGAPA